MINNHYGHDAGDKMLCLIADLCKKYFPEDCIYRMGRDEFLIICKNKEEVQVTLAAQSLLEEVCQAGYSISYGIEKQTSDFDLNKIAKNADTKMIDCKWNYYMRTKMERL